MAGSLPPRHRRADQGRGRPVLHRAGAWPDCRGGAGVSAVCRSCRSGGCGLARLWPAAALRYGFPVAPEQISGFMRGGDLARPALDGRHPRGRACHAGALARPPQTEFDAHFQQPISTAMRPPWTKATATRKPAIKDDGGAGERNRAGRSRQDRERRIVVGRRTAEQPRLPARRRPACRLPPQARLRPARPPLLPHRAHALARQARSAAFAQGNRQRRRRRALAALAPPPDRAAQAAAADRRVRLDEAAHRRLSQAGACGRAGRAIAPKSSPSARG